MTIKVQVIFNNQKWGTELAKLQQLKENISNRSLGRIELQFLPCLYTNFTEIPFADFYHPLKPDEYGKMIVRNWYVDNVYPLAPEEADVIMFVCNRQDWKGQASNGSYTYGHCQWNYPANFPIMLEMMVQEGDKSWKYLWMDAFVHYGTHELCHGLEQNGHEEPQDKTHFWDYMNSDAINHLFAELDYDKLAYQLTHKVGFRRRMTVFQKQGFPDLYFLAGDVMVPFAATYENFLKDFKNAIITKLPPDEFIKYRIANYNVVKAR